jgi:hypothetical protein
MTSQGQNWCLYCEGSAKNLLCYSMFQIIVTYSIPLVLNVCLWSLEVGIA